MSKISRRDTKTNTRRTGETIARKNKKGGFGEEKKRSSAIETIGRFTGGRKGTAVRSVEADRCDARRNDTRSAIKPSAI